MAKRKIAPALSGICDDTGPWSGQTWEQARAELRALLAVARAARDTLEIIQGTECGCGEPTGSGKGLGLDECPMDSEVELERALARLDRVSGAREGTP